MQVTQRRRLGAYYTPPWLVAAIVAEALPADRCRGRVVRVLDPACGDGRFLAAAATRVESGGGRAVLHGVDIDPAAVAAAREHLGALRPGSEDAARPDLRVGDALARDWAGARYDAVVGNPPFLNQLAAATSRGGRSRFGGGPYADAAAEFLVLAVRLAVDGGAVGLVLPQSLMAARDAAAVRTEVDRCAALQWMWWTAEPVFDAAVRTWAGVWRRGEPPGTVRRAHGTSLVPAAAMPAPVRWPALLHGDDLGGAAAPGGPVLGDIASFSADFRDQYYGLVGAVGDDVDGPPLVTSGLIDPGRCLWGQRPVRFAKRRYAAPRVDLGRLSPKLQRWAADRLVPKILVANQTTTIEAVHDPHGAWLPSVPVITAVTAEPQRVLSVLGSDAARRWVRAHAAGSGLSASAMRFTPALLASIPLP